LKLATTLCSYAQLFGVSYPGGFSRARPSFINAEFLRCTVFDIPLLLRTRPVYAQARIVGWKTSWFYLHVHFNFLPNQEIGNLALAISNSRPLLYGNQVFTASGPTIYRFRRRMRPHRDATDICLSCPLLEQQFAANRSTTGAPAASPGGRVFRLRPRLAGHSRKRRRPSKEHSNSLRLPFVHIGSGRGWCRAQLAHSYSSVITRRLRVAAQGQPRLCQILRRRRLGQERARGVVYLVGEKPPDRGAPFTRQRLRLRPLVTFNRGRARWAAPL